MEQSLEPKIIKQIRIRCNARAEQCIIERALEKREFRYIAASGFWTRPGSTVRLFVEGPYWLVYYIGDADDKPSYHGSTLKNFAPVLEEICG